MALKRLILTAGILCSIVSTSFAQDLQWRKFVLFDNKGGLNDNLSTTEIADNEATDIQNITFDVGGAIKKRNGYTTIPPIPLNVATGAVSTGAVTGITFYKQNNGTKFLVAICNQDGKAVAMEKPYNSTTGELAGGYWVNIDNAQLTTTTYTNNYQPDFAVAENKLVFTDGTSKTPFVWTGTGKSTKLTSSVNISSGSIVEYHKNQLFISGNTTFPSRVFFSELGDISTWTATDFFDVDTSDGSNVRALCSAFDSLYIFKDKSIWRLSGQERDSFVLQKMVDGIGTLSNSSVRVVNNYIYFTTAQNDIAVYDGAYTCQFISQKIRGTIGNLDFNRATNTAGLAFSTYKYNDYDYYVSVTESGGTGNNRVLVFDTQHKAWTKFKGINANCMCVGDDNDGKNVVYFGDYSGYVHAYPSSSYFDGNVATSSIAALYQTKWFKFSELCLGDKYWRLLKTYALTADNTTVYAECKSDFESSGRVFTINLEGSQAKWDVAQWDVDVWGGETIIVGRNEVEKGVNMFQLRYTQDSATNGFTILGYELFVEPSTRI